MRAGDFRRKLDCVLLPKDYLRFCLTGERATDMSDAAGTWLLDEARSPMVARRARRAQASIAQSSPRLVEGSDAVGLLRRRDRRSLAACRAGPLSPPVARETQRLARLGSASCRAGYGFRVAWHRRATDPVVTDIYRAAPGRLVHNFAHALPRRWYRMAAMLNGCASALNLYRTTFEFQPRRTRTRGRRGLSRARRDSMSPLSLRRAHPAQ